MNIKNARIYKLSAPLINLLDGCEFWHMLDAVLTDFAYQAPVAIEAVKSGFIAPLHPSVRTLAHQLSNDVTVIAFKRSEKILPAAVINEGLLPKIEAQEQEKGRPLSRKEKQSLKEELIQTLLPRALIRSKTTHAYIDSDNQWIVVDTPSAGTAEDILALLRKSLGSLPALLWLDNHKLNGYLQLWLQNKSLPAGFELGSSVQLKAPDVDGAKATFKDHLLTAEEVQSHLQDKLVTQLQLSKTETCTFTVRDDGSIAGIKWDGLITDQNDEMGWDDVIQRIEADALLITTEFNNVLNAISKAVQS